MLLSEDEVDCLTASRADLGGRPRDRDRSYRPAGLGFKELEYSLDLGLFFLDVVALFSVGTSATKIKYNNFTAFDLSSA